METVTVIAENFAARYRSFCIPVQPESRQEDMITRILAEQKNAVEKRIANPITRQRMAQGPEDVDTGIVFGRRTFRWAKPLAELIAECMGCAVRTASAILPGISSIHVVGLEDEVGDAAAAITQVIEYIHGARKKHVKRLRAKGWSRAEAEEFGEEAACNCAKSVCAVLAMEVRTVPVIPSSVLRRVQHLS